MTLLITGGASGIGAATARLAATRGHRRIAINYRSRDAQARKVVADIEAAGGQAVALPADVAREDDIVKLFDETEKALGPITRVVNSAGIGLHARVEDFDGATLARLFTVNTVGVMLCCREAARRLSTKRSGPGGHAGGVVVNVSSMAGTIGGRPGASAYAASKAAIDSFTMGFAKEVAQEGIRAVSLRPGMIETEMTERTLADRETRAAIEATIAMGRVGRADEIANAIVWLLSDEASFISGVTLDASGGGFVFGKR
ncbi:SDR family NAD(P)-dependent oxidoreductase [Reyranella sp.]|uniref:SDR family NAD(P)-dependent oxidoreductase n=1 Tax=Reyranella sp. TaxID=1929291 RepID=UPI003BAC5E53